MTVLSIRTSGTAGPAASQYYMGLQVAVIYYLTMGQVVSSLNSIYTPHNNERSPWTLNGGIRMDCSKADVNLVRM